MPADAASALVQAQQAFRNGAYATAESLLDSAETAGSGSYRFLADVQFLRARLYGELNRTDSARAAYHRVIALEPDYRGARLNLGNDAFREEQYRDALRYYHEELDRFNDPTALLYVGRSYAELGIPDSARAAYEDAIEANDTLAEAHVRLAQLMEAGGSATEALPHARRAVELQPDNPGYRYLLGRLLFAAGELEAALEQLSMVVAQRPNDHEVHYNLGQVLTRLGRSDSAAVHLAIVDSLRRVDSELNEWKTFTTLYPERPAVWATYGFGLMTAGRFSEAARAFNAALYLDPTNVDVRLMLANLNLRRGRVGAALRQYETVLRQDSARVDAWVNTGIAYARAGDPAAARAAWERALAIEPNHTAARSYLAGLSASR